MILHWLLLHPSDGSRTQNSELSAGRRQSWCRLGAAQSIISGPWCLRESLQLSVHLEAHDQGPIDLVAARCISITVVNIRVYTSEVQAYLDICSLQLPILITASLCQRREILSGPHGIAGWCSEAGRFIPFQWRWSRELTKENSSSSGNNAWRIFGLARDR